MRVENVAWSKLSVEKSGSGNIGMEWNLQDGMCLQDHNSRVLSTMTNLMSSSSRLTRYIETPKNVPRHRTALIEYSVGLQALRFVLNYGQY